MPWRLTARFQTINTPTFNNDFHFVYLSASLAGLEFHREQVRAKCQLREPTLVRGETSMTS